MLISQLAERAGVRTSTLRFYETLGLLQSDRSARGYRLYAEEAVERLSFITTAKQLGLPLEEIAELLRVREAGDCADVKTELRARLHARIHDAEQHITGLSTFITTLRRVVGHLDGLPARTGPCEPDCDVLPSVGTNNAAGAQDEARWRVAPVACSLTSASIQERTARWHRVLQGGRRETIDDGLRLTLPIDRAGAFTELAVAEQQCCPFYDFRIHLDGASMHVEVRAPQDGAVILAELFAPVS
ncbi:MerR family transcriptional regulator [Streptomyces sp. NPDC005506]|uniref:MerR family transcriptional regulator n=1 Tax=unclassified Streptomyces TaxID=2593676 RepID=UPI0036AED8A7